MKGEKKILMENEDFKLTETTRKVYKATCKHCNKQIISLHKSQAIAQMFFHLQTHKIKNLKGIS